MEIRNAEEPGDTTPAASIVAAVAPGHGARKREIPFETAGRPLTEADGSPRICRPLA